MGRLVEGASLGSCIVGARVSLAGMDMVGISMGGAGSARGSAAECGASGGAGSARGSGVQYGASGGVGSARGSATQCGASGRWRRRRSGRKAPVSSTVPPVLGGWSPGPWPKAV